MSAIVDSLTKKYSDMIKFARVEIPRSRTLSMTYSLSDFAVLFFKDGKLVEIKTGVISEDEIETCVRKVLEDKHPSS